MNNPIIKPVIFYLGDESKVVVEDKDEMKSSIFKNQYERAIDIIADFVDYNPQEPLTVPNIVAFCGDRGEGKTSCMMSLKNMLNPVFGDDAFDVLEPIDPSFFDDSHNILELVLGQLYNRFINERGREEYHDILLQQFNTVKNCVSTLKEGNQNVYDAIEELDELGNGMTLQKLMENLIKTYLNYVGKVTLAIVIDDMDYNWRRAYEMTQIISKYLCYHQCVLLISVSIRQMVDVIESSFKNELRRTGTHSNFYTVAYKYVEKLIPLQHRVEMPHVYDICDRPLEVYKWKGSDEKVCYDTIKEAVVNEIFIKTRYLFYNYRDGVSQIVPRNLRMLRQLLGLLIKMDVYHKDSKDEIQKERSMQNKLMFQSYFFTNWTRQLNKKNQDIVEQLMRTQDLSQINKQVVNFMKHSLPDENIAAFADIVKPANYSYNISIGDVFSLMNYIERNPREDNDQMMVFFLKSYYSMLLYHYYDDITVSSETLHSDEEKGGIYRTESWFKDTNKLQRFVNGNYFQYTHGDLLTGVVDHFNGLKTVKAIVDLDQISVGEYAPSVLFEDVKKIVKKNSTHQFDADKEKILRAELFVLMTSWGSDREIGADMKKQRDFPQPHHLVRFTKQTRSYMFDILAPFCNLINIKFAYDRFKELTGNLYEFCYEREWSLLRQMLCVVSDEKPEDLSFREKRLASDAIIRNAEVLTSMKEKVISLSSSGGDATKMTTLIAEFYEKIMDSEMVTYPTAPNEDPYTINFKFLKPVCDVLKTTNASEFYTLVMQSQLLRLEGQGSSSSDII